MTHPKYRGGYVLWAWLIIVCMIASLFFGLRWVTARLSEMRECRGQLQRIYHALELFEMENGYLPELSFFPSQPRTSSTSLLTVLTPYGLQASDAVCPSAPEILARQGLTYCWNVELSGKSLGTMTKPTWMLVEIQALSHSVQRPHFNTIHVLYSDGQVRRLRDIPHDIVLSDSP